MIRRNFEHPIQVGMSFGLVSGVITSWGSSSALPSVRSRESR